MEPAMKKTVLALAALILLPLISGCSSFKENANEAYDTVFDTAPTSKAVFHENATPIIEFNYDAADTLYKNVSGRELGGDSKVFVRRFLNENNPDDMAAFGKIMAEQVADRLAQRGMVITHGAPDQQDYMNNGMQPVEKESPANDSKYEKPARSAMLTGSYIPGDSVIYMTAKIVRLDDNAVVAGHSWQLPVTQDVRELLPQLQGRDSGLEPTVKTQFE